MLYESIQSQPVIGAERFNLRPVRESDAALIGLYAGDKVVAQNTRSVPHPLPPGAADAFVAQSMAEGRSRDVWVLDGSASGQEPVLGVISLTRLARDQSEMSFWIAPGMWNAGLASEAVAALVAANPHRAKSLCAEAFQDNPGSARVLTNSGFAYLGDAESWSVARGAMLPTWTYLRKM